MFRSRRIVGWRIADADSAELAGELMRAACSAQRHALYELARRANPDRWIANTRNWNPVGLVVLNPQEETAES